MPHPQLDRRQLQFRPLATRESKLRVERDMVDPAQAPSGLSAAARNVVAECAERIRAARRAERPVILAFGAHTIKNGLGPVLIRLLEGGWIRHLATNGAGIIHDWEFAFHGRTSEDVRAYVAQGQFGLWEETGRYLNLALLLGARDGLGYGESVGRLIESEECQVPTGPELLATVRETAAAPDFERIAASADLLAALSRSPVEPGRHTVSHPWKQVSVQAAAYRLGLPFTGHPMIGHDIIYSHPLNCCAAVGRAAQRDFLRFAHQAANLDGGVYLSVGSAVMSPMIFEKAFSMARNLALQAGTALNQHFIAVVDLAESHWDWTKGEPPPESPDYYLRYCKSFRRMGGTMRYATADNRDFLLALYQTLAGDSPQA